MDKNTSKLVGGCYKANYLNFHSPRRPSSSILLFFFKTPSLTESVRWEREREREMGNCQAIDAATLVIQHPNGKIENFYWPVSASEVMKTNPGHYVALLLSTTLYDPTNNNGECPNNGTANNNSLRVTRIKLLRPTDTLVLGHVYRLITTQGLSYL